jgi:CheY-like chemotaxis protein
MQTQIDAALAAGFDGYWTKPINVAHILAGLDRVLSPPVADAPAPTGRQP